METAVQSALKVQTVSDYAKAKGFVQIAPKVRVNKNGYPFITFINAKNEAENVYFSKNASKKVADGETITRDMLKDISVAETKNAEGEMRTKLVSSDRIELSDILG